MTSDEAEARLAAIEAKVDDLLSTHTRAVGGDGGPPFTDPYGTPMQMTWQEGYTLQQVVEAVKRLKALPSSGGGASLAEIEAVVRNAINGTHLETA